MIETVRAEWWWWNGNSHGGRAVPMNVGIPQKFGKGREKGGRWLLERDEEVKYGLYLCFFLVWFGLFLRRLRSVLVLKVRG